MIRVQRRHRQRAQKSQRASSDGTALSTAIYHLLNINVAGKLISDYQHDLISTV